MAPEITDEFCPKKLAPPLKWAGGKRWLVGKLKPLWALHSERRLVEPLCGGLAVTLGLRPTRALLNDINIHLINFYRWVSQGLYIDLIMKNEEELYYAWRERFNFLISAGRSESKEAAMIFYYLNRTGYNGLCRFNKKGYFNVPFGRYKKINYRSDFEKYQAQFNKWQFKQGDFEDLELQEDDFIYADPPYDTTFTSYSAGGFSFDDQKRLARWLAAHPGPVLLSNQATPRIISLYEGLGFAIEYLKAPRLISASGDRTPAEEILARKGF